MIKKLNIETDFQEIFELSQFAFQYKLSDSELQRKREEAERHIIWGNMVNGQIGAKLHLIPLTVNINDTPLQMGGISSVATWPEYRRNGMVQELLAQALQHMKANNQVLSYLSPFSVPFYRKYGWEIAFSEKLYKIPIERLRKEWSVGGYMRRISPDIAILNEVYKEHGSRYSGTIIRDEKWWRQRVLKEDAHIAVAFNENHQAIGYVIYEVKEKLFKVIEHAYQSLQGLKLLLQFIGNHDSMAKFVELVAPENDNIPLLIDEPRFETKVDPYFMARVVDVHAFLRQFPFAGSSQERSVSLYVEDEFMQDNTGVYQLHQNSEGVNISKITSNKKAGIVTTIQQFTVMFLGYRRPRELYQLGLVHGDEPGINALEELIPHQQTYFPDYF